MTIDKFIDDDGLHDHLFPLFEAHSKLGQIEHEGLEEQDDKKYEDAASAQFALEKVIIKAIVDDWECKKYEKEETSK